MSVRDAIASHLVKVVPKGTVIDLRVPDENQTAHYATSVAFKLAKGEGKNPREVGEKIVLALLESAPAEFFDRVEVTGPGFINFWLSQETLNAELEKIIKEGKKYGTSRILKDKIQLEFISANPTGPLTLANGRGGFLGDVLGNVLKAAGADVEKEYYVNDTGNQVLTFGKSILAARGIIKDEQDFYKGGYVNDWAKKNSKIVAKLKDKPLELGERAAKDILKKIKTDIEKKAKIKFDRYTSEKKIHQLKLPGKILQIFEKGGWAYEQDGAVWLKTTAFGDDKDRVLITSKDKFPTYLLADAGHYLETKKRGFDTKINILGPDHYGYVKRIQAVARILKFKKSEVLITQAIRLMRDGQEFKMSKRKGEFVTFEDLVSEVGMDSARFFFLMIAPETHMDFDMNLAKERSNKNPVFYLQYAYVRANNILKKAKALAAQKADLKLLNTEADVKLIRTLAQLPEVIADTANDYQVHRLTRYALGLAGDFHNFYEKERVLDEPKDIAAARYKLVKATAIILEDLFGILGITKLKKM
ncbi:MAG: arginine--tRNA ligase [Minisyncoccia bacterium]|jgi:arginyl-tRNA synthetase